MTDKFRNTYRIPSARLQHWDYRWAGAYFITICTQNREHYFGEIDNGKMQLSPVGAIADVLWHEIKNHAHNIELGAFVVMPNHVHGILILNGNNTENANDGNNVDGVDGDVDVDVDVDDDDDVDVDVDVDVETGHALSLQRQRQRERERERERQQQQTTTEKTIGQQRFQHIGKNSVSSIIGSYKSAVTKHAHRLGFDFAWQTRFHDHIIRDNESFVTIQTYILENPVKWEDDKFYCP